NAQARHAEMLQVLLAADRRDTERANVQNATLVAAIDRVRQAVVSEGERVRDSVAELADGLTGDGASGSVGAEQGEGGLMDGAGKLEGWLSLPNVGAGEPPKFTVPLSLVYEGLDDVELDFGDAHVAAWVP